MQALLHNMQRLLDTIARAEALLDEQQPSGSNGVTNDEAWKRVSRLANEYNQVQYLLQKVQAEGCELAVVVTKVRRLYFVADAARGKHTARCVYPISSPLLHSHWRHGPRAHQAELAAL